MKLKGNTVSHYSIEDVLHHEEDKQSAPPDMDHPDRSANLML